MNQHLSNQQILDYRKRILPAPQRLAVSDHLAVCETCRRRLSPVEQPIGTRQRFEQALTADLLAARNEPLSHLSYEEMAAYVDGRATSLESVVVREHVKICAMCATEMEELVSFRDLMAQSPDREQTPGTAGSTVLQDVSGVVDIGRSGKVHVTSVARLPRNVARWINELLTTGLVTPAKTMTALIDHYRAATSPAPLLAARSAQSVMLIRPVSTALRSTRPTLQWNPVPGAREYSVVIARQANSATCKIVWEASVGAQLSLVVPAEAALKPGQSYCWQVTAHLPENDLDSTPAWFMVLSTADLEAVETAEREYAHSALICTALYEAYGLHAEAVVTLQQLADLNPDNPLMQSMQEELIKRLALV